MTTSSRLRGNIKPIFTIKIGAGTATSYADDLKKGKLEEQDKDASDITFAEAAAGLATDAVLTITTVTSFDTTALFAALYDNAGAACEIVWGPYGNATATATKPHFKLTVESLPNRPAIETEARRTAEGASAEIEIRASGPAAKLVA